MTENNKAEKLAEKALKAGEEICWRGEAVPFKLIEKDSRKSLLIRTIVGVLGSIVMLGSCFINNDGKLGFPLLIVALLMLMVFAPMFEANSLREYRYFLTNRRAIIVTDDGTVYCMDLKHVDQITVLAGHSIGDSLVLGSAMLRDLKKQQLRWLAAHPRENPVSLDGNLGAGMIFYSIKNANEAKDCLAALSKK